MIGMCIITWGDHTNAWSHIERMLTPMSIARRSADHPVLGSIKRSQAYRVGADSLAPGVR